jgi:plastocyanin
VSSIASKKKTVKKKATTAKAVRVRKPHHPWDHHDLLLIVSGAFVVIILILFFSGSLPMVLFSGATHKTETTYNGTMVENQNEKTVTISDFTYTPEVLKVKEGTVVTWTNTDAVAHSATADDGSFDTGLLEKGESGSVTLNEAGEYTYHCSLHPNMTGKIIVEK